MKAINRYTKQEHEVLDYHPDRTGKNDKFNTWVLIKTKPKGKAKWHSLKDYDLKEE